MQIQVVSSIGTGNTELSAFDHALKNAGILNFNLIPLSSVIPSEAEVIKTKYFTHTETVVGKRLYVVMAENRISDLDSIIGAGLGWYFFSDGGVFVEHTVAGSSSKSVEEELKKRIDSSLMDLCQHRGEQFVSHNVHTMISICPAIPSPRSTLTVAVFQSEPW